MIFTTSEVLKGFTAVWPLSYIFSGETCKVMTFPNQENKFI